MSDDYVIYWCNPNGIARREWEEFASLEEAQDTLKKWAADYPWNEYTLARVVGVQQPTSERPPDPLRITYKAEPGTSGTGTTMTTTTIFAGPSS